MMMQEIADGIYCQELLLPGWLYTPRSVNAAYQITQHLYDFGDLPDFHQRLVFFEIYSRLVYLYEEELIVLEERDGIEYWSKKF